MCRSANTSHLTKLKNKKPKNLFLKFASTNANGISHHRRNTLLCMREASDRLRQKISFFAN